MRVLIATPRRLLLTCLVAGTVAFAASAGQLFGGDEGFEPEDGTCNPGFDNCGFAPECTTWCRPWACNNENCNVSPPSELKCWKCDPL